MRFELPPPQTRPADLSGRGMVFLGGAMRSGTTLVQRCLDAHPAVFAGPQLLFTPTFMELYESAEARRRSLAGIYLERGRTEAMVRALFAETLLSVAWSEGARVAAEKTPENVLYFDSLARLFPEARFVFIVRDPRAVVASRLRVKERIDRKTGRRPAPSGRVALALVEEVEAHARAGLSFTSTHPERSSTVRFEAFVQEPERATRALTDALDLEWHEAMLHPEREERGTAETDGVWHTAEQLRRPIDRARIDGWRQELSTTLRVGVESQLDRQLWERLGYSLDRHPAATFARPFCAAHERLRRLVTTTDRVPRHLFVPHRRR